MLKEVTADVRRETRNAQRPQQLSDMSRTFYFAAAAPSVAAPQVVEKSAPAPDRTLDVAYWNSAQTANDCDSVRAYIQRFPEGVFIDLARLAERRLCAPGRRITVIAGPTAPDAAAQDPPPPAPAMAPSAPVRLSGSRNCGRPGRCRSARAGHHGPAGRPAARGEPRGPAGSRAAACVRRRPSRTAIWRAISSSN